MPIAVKICGLSTIEAVDAAIAGGARYLGFVFFGKSPRDVSNEAAGALAARAGGRAKLVGLFVDPEPGIVEAVRTQINLDVIQLHGGESPAFAASLRGEVWKAVPVCTRDDLTKAAQYSGAVQRVLYDAKPPVGADLPGGNGLRFDWTLLQGFDHPLPWALSGGLDANNIAEAARVTSATLLDVSSGVESSSGVKDVDKIAAFLKAASHL